LNHACLGHVSEIADAESPYTPRGCPFQAWSLAELLRLERVVLADNTKSITGASLSCAPTSPDI
jgi:glycogen debranching enzyme